MLTINVTEEDIKNGEQAACQNCPVALALQRQIRTFYRIGVTYNTIFLGYDANGRLAEVDVPYEVQNFLFDFDNGTPVNPFSFNLNVPADLTRLSDS